jgi:hypothetical protein
MLNAKNAPSKSEFDGLLFRLKWKERGFVIVVFNPFIKTNI